MKVTINIPELMYQRLKESSKEYDLTVPEYIEHLISEDQSPMYELSHETGVNSFYNLKDAILAMKLINEYFYLEQPDDTYASFFTNSPGENGRIWERVAGGDYYVNGSYSLVKVTD